MKTFFALILLSVPFLMAFSPGDFIPDFSAKNQDGKLIHLSDFKGKFVLIYFYPKDETCNCTTEASTFRDEFKNFSKVSAVVLGVSRQNEKSHQAFKRHHNLPFDLLVDSDGALAKTLGVGSFPVLGMSKRQSILIGPDSKLIRFYSEVNPLKHAKEVLGDIEKARAAGTH